MKTEDPALAVDVLHHLDAELATARVRAAQAVDQAQALAELRVLAIEFATRTSADFLTLAALIDGPRDEEERAHLEALIRRAIPNTTTNGGTTS